MNEDDSELHAQWQRLSRETPPAALDDAIRAAAHRAVHAKPSAASPRARAPWPTWATFAAAASIGAIAIGVWQLQPRDVEDTQMVASDIPARQSAPAMDAASASRTRAEGRIAGAPAALDAQSQPPVAGSPADALPGGRTQQAATPPPAEQDVMQGARKSTTGASAMATQDESSHPIAAAPPSPAARNSIAITPPVSAQDKVSQAFTAAPPPPSAPQSSARLAAASPSPSESRQAAAPSPPSLPRSSPDAGATARDEETSRAVTPSPFPAERAAEPSREAAPALEKKVQPASAKPATPGFAANAAPSAAGASLATAPARSNASQALAMKPSDAKEALAAAGAPASKAAEASVTTAKDRSVDDFVARIRRALEEHRDTGAAAELTAMRARYDDADARLPADLRAWAAQVPRVQR